MAPIDVPNEIKPEEALDLGIEGGVAGGVEGGVPGGVVGGVVGGLRARRRHRRRGWCGSAARSRSRRIIRKVEPVYPDLAVQSRISALVILEAEVDVRGHVKTVKVLRGHPLFDEAAMEAVKQWRYQPLLLNGEPTGFILTVTVNFNLRPSRRRARPVDAPLHPSGRPPFSVRRSVALRAGPLPSVVRASPAVQLDPISGHPGLRAGAVPMTPSSPSRRYWKTRGDPMDLDVRRNPALLKLDLYCKGMRIDDSCLVEEDGGRKILRTRAGLGSGLEVVLPGGLWTNVPVTERFAAAARRTSSTGRTAPTLLRLGDEAITTLELSPRPAWYDRKTTTGKPMTRVGTLQGTYLGVYPAKVCEYWTEKPEKTNCKFCSVGLNLGVDDADDKSVGEVMEVIRAARAESGLTYVDFNTGHYEGETYLDILEPYIRRIKSEIGILVGVQTPPHSDLRRYDALREMGVNRVSFCFEIFDPCVFKEVCPGKDRQYGLKRYLDAVRVLRGARPRRGPDTSRGSRTARSSSASSRPSPRSRPSTGSRRSAPSRPCACSGRSPAPTTPTCRRRRRSRSSPSSGASTRRAWSRGCRSASPRTST